MNYVRILCTLTFVCSVMYMFLDCEIKSKKKLYQLVAFVTCILIFDISFFVHYGYDGFMYQYPILVQIPIFIAFKMVSKYKLIKVFFILLTAYAISSALVVIGSIISVFTGFSESTVNVICLSLYIPAWYTLHRFFKPVILYMLRTTEKGWLGFCVIPLLSIVLVYSTGEYNVYTVMSGSGLLVSSLSLILSFFSYALIFRFFHQNREQSILMNEHNLLNMQVTTSKHHLEALQDSQEKTILYRHDMRHHLNLINSYILDNNICAAKKHIADVEKSINATIVESYCENYSLNMILTHYINKANEYGIDVVCNVNVPQPLHVSDMDLCIIFSNALENAINATRRITSINSKNINIMSKVNDNKVIIRIINHYDGSVLFINNAPARNKENEGLGTKSIAAVVEKYQGVCDFSTEDGIFKASIIL